MQYEFDREIDRKHNCDLKWNKALLEARLSATVAEDFIPMWIADTDFACAPHILEAVRARTEQEIFGYCGPTEQFYEAVCWWEKQRFSWDVQPKQITALPSVVAGINIAIRAFSKEGDGVIIQPPVYDPFSDIVRRTGRNVVNNPLKKVNGRYEMDFELLERQAAEPSTRMMILCSPHNPVGRVWSREELTRLADICIRNEVLLISDEIHSDIVYEGHTHYPLLSLSGDYGAHVIHLTAPSKTFNIPGLKCSIAVIADEGLKHRFDEMRLAMSLDIRNTFGLEGVMAAYSPASEPWLREELAYLKGNIAFVSSFVKEHLPEIEMEEPEGTFLCWLDCKGLGLPEEELLRRINLEAGVVCIPGTWFGPGGENHLRLNVGCTRAILQKALLKMEQAIRM